MKARDHLKFYGREKANETVFYLSATQNQLLDKGDRVITRAVRYWIISNLMLKHLLQGLS